MTTGSDTGRLAAKAVAAAQDALRAIRIVLPHLAGLAHQVRVSPTGRVATAAVFKSGRMIVNPQWFTDLTPPERIFVTAHELMHLALRSHDRCQGSDARLFNAAHDYIINDMLSTALTCPVPAGGLAWHGAALLSAEEIVSQLRTRAAEGGVLGGPWRGSSLSGKPVEDPAGSALGAIGEALVRAGIPARPSDRGPLPEGGREPDAVPLDVFDDEVERAWFPDEVLEQLRQPHLEAAIDRAVALGAWRDRVEQSLSALHAKPHHARGAFFQALAQRTRPPWHLALQRWLEDAAPASRTFARASRRQGDRLDVVLPGRRREGWTLNIVLDTSGSMWSDLQTSLGHLKGFCEAAGVHTLRVLQCSDDLEVDERIDVDRLDRYEIKGGGGSTVAPGMLRLAQDPEVEAVLVLTDGAVDYPADPMPYHVLWAITLPQSGFAPPYGAVVHIAA
jgi:predicted metal-dependent peptidase